MKKLLCLAAAAAVTATLVPAVSHAGELRSARVYYNDLDLTKAEGAAELQRRIGFAVKRVCYNNAARDLGALMEVSDCRAAALDGAMPKVELAIANARSGGQLAAREIEVPSR